MKIQDINDSKIPLVKIDKKLNKFKGKILFQNKLDMANQLIDNAKLPVITPK